MKITQWFKVIGAGVVLCSVVNLHEACAAPGGEIQNTKGNQEAASEPGNKSHETYRTLMEVKDDAEWRVISERIEQVNKARHELESTGRQSAHDLARRLAGRKVKAKGKGNKHALPPAGIDAFGPEEERLFASIETNASKAEIGGALSQFERVRQARQVRLDKAKAELRQVLSVRQEAIAILTGLL